MLALILTEKGNTFDLVLTESYGRITIKNCTWGSFLLDHCVVLYWKSIKKEDIETKLVTYRNLKHLDCQVFEDEIRTEYPDDKKLGELINSFESNLRDGLDKLALERTREITSRKNSLGLENN